MRRSWSLPTTPLFRWLNVEQYPQAETGSPRILPTIAWQMVPHVAHHDRVTGPSRGAKAQQPIAVRGKLPELRLVRMMRPNVFRHAGPSSSSIATEWRAVQ